MNKLKKFAAIALSAVMSVSALGIATFAADKMMGDVNSDGKVTASDVLLLRKSIAGQNVGIDADLADVNLDGKITASDVLMIRKAIAGAAQLPTAPSNSTAQPTTAQTTAQTTAKPTQTTTQPTTQTTTKPIVPNYQLPSNYPTEVNSYNVLVDQVGYSVGSAKNAVIKFEKRRQTAECYLVEATTNSAMFKGTTASSEKETNVAGLVEDMTNFFAAKFDFSDWDVEGTYYIATPFGRSYNFTISKTPYDSTQDKMITALYYSRCGQDLDAKICGQAHAHKACHNNSTPALVLNLLSDGKYTSNPDLKGKASDFAGGLHDAGDYGRYTQPGNGAAADLLVTADLFPNGATTNVITDKSGEKISDVLDEARYEIDWMTRMQNPNNGGVYFRIATQFAWNGWTTPDKDSSGRFMVSREIVKSTAGFAGNAAYCYTMFKDIDKTFANKCLAAAKKAYDFTAKYYKDGVYDTTFTSNSEDPDYRAQAGDYGSGDSSGEYFYAAAALYRATGETKYKTKADEFVDNGVNPVGINGYSVAGAGAVSYLINPNNDKTRQAKLLEKMKASADSNDSNTKKSIVGTPISTMSSGWGCNTIIGDSIQNMAFVDYFSKTNTYEASIRDTMHFMFGTNGTGYTFVTGVGSQSPVHPHNRHDACGEVAPGWVVMGYHNGVWEDNSNSADLNEIAIYTNAVYYPPMAYIVEKDRAKK